MGDAVEVVAPAEWAGSPRLLGPRSLALDANHEVSLPAAVAAGPLTSQRFGRLSLLRLPCLEAQPALTPARPRSAAAHFGSRGAYGAV
ncbi:MAG: hypothetical protein WEB00_14010 [Dehalococcoidia bacterium]